MGGKSRLKIRIKGDCAQLACWKREEHLAFPFAEYGDNASLLGLPCKELVYDLCGGIPGGRKMKATRDGCPNAGRRRPCEGASAAES